MDDHLIEHLINSGWSLLLNNSWKVANHWIQHWIWSDSVPVESIWMIILMMIGWIVDSNNWMDWLNGLIEWTNWMIQCGWIVLIYLLNGSFWCVCDDLMMVGLMIVWWSCILISWLMDWLIHWFIDSLIHSIPLRKNIGYSFCDRLDHDSICILHDDDWMRSTTYSLRIKGWIRLSKKQIMIMNSNWIVIQVWLDILPSFLLDLYRYILVYFDWIWIIIWNSYFWHSTSFRIGRSWSWTLLYSRIHIGSIHLDLYPTLYIIHHTSYIIHHTVFRNLNAVIAENNRSSRIAYRFHCQNETEWMIPSWMDDPIFFNVLNTTKNTIRGLRWKECVE